MEAEPHSPRAAALAAVVAAAGSAGIDARDARVIANANHTIVLLPRAELVGKVAAGAALSDSGGEELEREVRVGRHLALCGAPIARPASADMAGPHAVRADLVSFWEYHAPAQRPTNAAVPVGRALREFHDALADFPEPLPSLADRLDLAAQLYADASATPGLGDDDRRLAARVHRLLPALLATGGPPVALHGEPHDGNIVWTSDGPLLIDFSAACRGPAAWDLAHLPPAALTAYPDVELSLVERFRDAVSFAVAAWCWAHPEGPRVVREAAAFHLAALHASQLAQQGRS